MNPIITEILNEVERATRKFPTWPTDPLHALAVLGEEFGELGKEVLQSTYEPHKSSPEAIRKEAMQTAAMALRFCMSLDQYQYDPGHQHAQGVRAACAACDRGDFQLGHSDTCAKIQKELP